MGKPKGFKHSDESRLRMSEAHKKSTYVPSEETRRKMSEAARQSYIKFPAKRIRTAEQRRAVSERQKGRPGTPHTSESKKKLSDANRGEKSHNWKGGRKMRDGYVLILMPDHPNAYYDKQSGKKRYVLEHRYVMSEMLGRPLDRWDIVHHKNADRADNRPENLEHLRGDNAGCRSPLICPKCSHAF